MSHLIQTILILTMYAVLRGLWWVGNRYGECVGWWWYRQAMRERPYIVTSAPGRLIAAQLPSWQPLPCTCHRPHDCTGPHPEYRREPIGVWDDYPDNWIEMWGRPGLLCGYPGHPDTPHGGHPDDPLLSRYRP